MPYSNDPKPSSSYSNDTKPSNSFTNDSKPFYGSYLLANGGFYLLLNSGGRLKLSGSYAAPYTNDTKP